VPDFRYALMSQFGACVEECGVREKLCWDPKKVWLSEVDAAIFADETTNTCGKNTVHGGECNTCRGGGG